MIIIKHKCTTPLNKNLGGHNYLHRQFRVQAYVVSKNVSVMDCYQLCICNAHEICHHHEQNCFV